ncbi:Env9p NDAI_0E01130 [Naumovozyma dairenensis CBS 421]|uniref:Ketoreductase (KR) domain-containing protein n=1 Tax=Naumovozyma dairenensis (strain ATCC 10597 / BCRC 20456 / CBS 421 / NBRC 0211 / NRRL Y-12639) TaxID=1071378 RepID=G0WB09_NAUDC|nr:hypothetical protein NDAI_0E01130 [Naumovozyma dairenensis CBS 421]CCD24929.1 hypothetical protein NDAI_0E01130 [Naumovozyma dairenensis CBS 421]
MTKKMIDLESLPYYDPLTNKKVAVITGGNSGIGWYTVLHLYMHGVIIYICGRNSHKVNRAMKDIQNEAFRRRSLEKHDFKEERSFGAMIYIHMDLTDLKTVERGCLKIIGLERQIDILINNAAVLALPYELTKDGFEIQLQTNYIAHFLLSLRLLPLLKKGHGRIITLSSVGHLLEFKYWKLDIKWDYKPNMIFTWIRYAVAKTASIQYTKMLSIKHPDVLCLSLHPGLVMNTNLFSYWTRLPLVGIFFWVLFQIIGYFFGVSNEEGSIATVRCALSADLTVEKDNGKYFTTGGVESTSSRVANNLDNAASTWIWTVRALKERGFDVK